jgi:hypothetical protein
MESSGKLVYSGVSSKDSEDHSQIQYAKRSSGSFTHKEISDSNASASENTQNSKSSGNDCLGVLIPPPAFSEDVTSPMDTYLLCKKKQAKKASCDQSEGFVLKKVDEKEMELAYN